MARTPPNLQILIAGGGIAGLTAAIAFASRGFSVGLFEQAPAFSEIGAGLQLSPNATRILRRLGVLDLLLPAAVRPQAVILRDARSLTELARVPLGAEAEKRWGAPYVTVHRADLQSALLARAGQETDLRIMTGAKVRDAAAHARGITISVDRNGNIEEHAGHLLIGADGVWSKLRHRILDGMDNSFTGLTAWRATVRQGSGGFPERLIAPDVVTAFLNRNFHLVTYPLRAGAALNLVAITRGGPLAETWDAGSGPQPLFDAMDKAARPLAEFAANASGWVCWPLHVVDAKGPWTRTEGVALIGDAAHAMTPFAAQGAAMAIEDAEVLANLVAATPHDLPAALARYEALRRPRIRNVAARGRFNHFVWHAWGPVALGRNMVLRALPGKVLADQFGRHYGYDATKSPG